MSDDISKKITIEVEVTSGGQQQINQYKAAFDSLRSAISSLDKPIADFSKNIRTMDKDIAQMAASAEKWAAGVSAVTKQMSGDQAKASKEANQGLKTSLTEADIIKQQAFVKDLSLRSAYYAQVAEAENKQYARQKEKLDGLFKDKNSDQALYQKEAQQLLQGHYDSLVKITDDYLKESTTELMVLNYGG